MAAPAEATTATNVISLDQQQQNGIGATRKWTSGWKCESKLPIEKLWAVGGDFTSVHKWIKGIVTCDITGDPTQPGCLRHCKAEGLGADGSILTEKLLVLNNEEHLMKYSLLEDNFLGFKDYVGTFKIDPNPSPSPDPPSAESDGAGSGGCTMNWSMEVAPVEGKSEEEVVQFSAMMFSSALNGLEAFASTI
jgi:hypothetical protein